MLRIHLIQPSPLTTVKSYLKRTQIQWSWQIISVRVCVCVNQLFAMKAEPLQPCTRMKLSPLQKSFVYACCHLVEREWMITVRLSVNVANILSRNCGDTTDHQLVQRVSDRKKEKGPCTFTFLRTKSNVVCGWRHFSPQCLTKCEWSVSAQAPWGCIHGAEKKCMSQL